MQIISQVFQEISPADFFYRNKEIAGFSNPARAIFSAIRELIENSLDATEPFGILPDIYIRLSSTGETEEEGFYTLRVEDNGSGIPSEYIPLAFCQFLFSSKYKLKQTRGTFGLGGTMTILYGQITTNKPVEVLSSTGDSKIYGYRLMIDIERNQPIILEKKVYENDGQWHGTIVEVNLEGDYSKAKPKVIEYLKQTAIANPYANIMFVDPKGRLYKFERTVSVLPPQPKETLPHPHGVDVETIYRIIRVTKCKTLLDFMQEHFHRVGRQIAKSFLEFAGFPEDTDPKRLKPEEIVKLVQAMKSFNGFLPPDASCLSPLGEEILKAGIMKELEPEFAAVTQRKPSAYSGHPFIVEVGVAYGGKVPVRSDNDITLYRFANKIPLVYDESGDVSWKVIKSIDWRRYNVEPGMPIAIIVHICSTKIPWKTVGKEMIADRPEISREILNGVREVARKLKVYLSRKEKVKREKERLSVFLRYLPKIAEFSAKLAREEKVPDIKNLLRRVRRFGEG
ncbi:MAG: DNA topoisomerase VI subunit B [Candidatus Bathyarchaeia archaeon]|nr:DNA topoisomerase VI subunit B [Candidatus Bathyarchaeota archaeon]